MQSIILRLAPISMELIEFLHHDKVLGGELFGAIELPDNPKIPLFA
jgi:hypothetical protein